MDDQKTIVVSVHAKDCVDYQCRRCGQCCRHIKDSLMVESLDAYRLANYLRGCDPNICTIDDVLTRYCEPRVGAAHRCIAIPRFSFVRLYIAVPLPLRVVCHKSKAMEEEFFFCQPFQNCQLCTGNFGIDTIFVNVSASIDNIVFCVVYISVIAQAIQRVLSTVKAIMSAVGLFRYIESHPELVTSANQAGKKSFICNHAAPPLTCLCHAEIQQR